MQKATRVLVLASFAVSSLWLPQTTQAVGPFLEPDAIPLVTLTGETPNDTFGWVAERLGDLDGDGAPDFIVGAPTSAAGGPNAGRAYVYSGRTGVLLHAVTGQPNERFGYAVAGVGDADGDGVPDYAVGGPGNLGLQTPLPGRVTLYSGGTHQVLRSWSGDADSFFGADVNGAGDVDGDGLADVLVGAPRTSRTGRLAGRVQLLSGGTGSTIWTRDGLAAGDLLGTAVGGLGDLDGDGKPEQGAGARNAGKGGGLAYVLAGADGSVARTLHPSGTAVDFGWFFVHDAGDLDGDGVKDVYVGDFADAWQGPNTGRGYVYSGASGERIRTMNAEVSGDGFGVGRGIADMDGDGRADLFLAAYTSSAGAPGGGRAYVISGRNGRTLRTITGTVAGASLGVDAVGLGDVNGDGLTDFLLTTFNEVYVVAGTTLSK